MIVLDTNVISELLRSSPDAGVISWLERQAQSALFTTALTRAEMLYGVRILPDGARRNVLGDAITEIFDVVFAGRIIGFDRDASDAYAAIASERKLAGRPISQMDAMIAAIAQSRGAIVATRNTKDFEECGVELVNPWNA